MFKTKLQLPLNRFRNSRIFIAALSHKLIATTIFLVILLASGLSVYAAQRNHSLDLAERAKSTKKVSSSPPSANPNSSVSSTASKPPTNEAKPSPKAASPPPAALTPLANGHFGSLGLGAALPSDATCAGQIKTAVETRPANSSYNNTRGIGTDSTYPRVTGNYSGTTDEILQWAACKWGIDEDIVRAQAAVESWWFQRHPGDFTTDSSICVPGHRTLGADGQPGQCPETIGILQVRFQYHSSAFANNNATNSTAYNADYVYAFWRDCYNGNMTWLNDVERGSDYAAGDLWGCVGVWYAGRWHTTDANSYIASVKNYVNTKVWESADFKSAT